MVFFFLDFSFFPPLLFLLGFFLLLRFLALYGALVVRAHARHHSQLQFFVVLKIRVSLHSNFFLPLLFLRDFFFCAFLRFAVHLLCALNLSQHACIIYNSQYFVKICVCLFGAFVGTVNCLHFRKRHLPIRSNFQVSI